MKVAIVTGANGKLAPFVVSELVDRGYDGITQIGDATLHSTDHVPYAFDRHNYNYGRKVPVDLIHLAGMYKSDDITDGNLMLRRSRLYQQLMDANYFSLVNAVEYLSDRLRSFVFVTAAGPTKPEGPDHAYYSSKRAAEIYASHFYTGPIRGGILTPAWPIDSDERRKDVAARLVDFVSVPTYRPIV